MSLDTSRNGSLVVDGPSAENNSAALSFAVNGDAPRRDGDYAAPREPAVPRESQGPRESAKARDAAVARARKKRFHRISTVREREGVSLRSVARALHIDVRSLRKQEDESNDIMLSTLYEWQKVLDVPISELLVDSTDPLSPAVLQRARLVKIMKTVAAILERTDSKPIKRLAEMLSEQLVEMMPELKDVSPWHAVGQRRSSSELGRIAERRLPDDFFME